ANIHLDNVIAKDDTDRITVGKILRQAESFRDAALSLLVGIVQMFQAKITTIPEKAEEISGIFPTRHEKDLSDTGVDEGLDRVIHHGLVVNGKKVLIGNFGQRIQSATRSTGQYDTPHSSSWLHIC